MRFSNDYSIYTLHILYTDINTLFYNNLLLVNNPCSTNNGGCSHLCLLSAVDPRNYSCDCPTGMILSNVSLTCNNNSTGGNKHI